MGNRVDGKVEADDLSLKNIFWIVLSASSFQLS